MLQRLLTMGKRAPEIPEVDVAQAVRARDDGDVQFVDVREPEEWASGVIPGATRIPLGNLAERKGELDPTLPVVTVCRSGNRSLTAADILIEYGFTDAKSLAGGMIAWTEAGQPVSQ